MLKLLRKAPVWSAALAIAITMGCADGATPIGSDASSDAFNDGSGSCSEGDKRCSGLGNVETCQGGSYTATEACSSGCSGGACNTGACNDGATRCNAIGNVETCSGGSYTETEGCDNGCFAGSCNPPGGCTEGDKACNSFGNVATCQSGTFVETENCGGQGCSGGVCGSTSGCTDGTRRCNNIGNVETCQSGSYSETEQCSSGCSGGVCNSDLQGGTCDRPIPLSVGGTAESTTNTFNNANQWSGTCTSKYLSLNTTGTETIFDLSVPQTMALQLTLTPQSGDYFGMYMRSDCTNSLSEYHDYCDGNPSPGAPVSITDIVAKGNYYLFVDSFIDFSGGDVQVSAQQTTLPVCANQVPQLIPDVTTTVTRSASTEDVNGYATWKSVDCPQDAFDSTGSEAIFAFAVAEETSLTISAADKDGNRADCEIGKCKIGLYVRSECEVEDSQVACGYSDSGTTPATLTHTFRPGSYFIFIDDFSDAIDTPQSFDLTITPN